MGWGRFALLAVAAAVALIAWLSARPLEGARAGEADGPNILVIVTDDQRLGTLEVMPATRRFFSDGTNYQNAFAVTPQCCPSRASLLSGRYTHNHGVESNSEAGDFEPGQSWPRLIDEAGYRTGLFGKYLNGWGPDDPVPNFDESFVGFDRKHSDSAEDSSAFITGLASRFIRQSDRASDPWAVQLELRAPHAPRVYPKRYEGTKLPKWTRSPATRERDFKDKHPDLADVQDKSRRHGEVRADQLRMLAAADDALRDVYRMLQRSGELAETVVVFLSDNGYYWGEHGLTGKGLPYLDSHRIPMLARGPGIGSGDSDQLVATIDVAPTILEAAGIEADYPIDGRSLVSGPERDWLLLEGSNDLFDDEAPLWRHGYFSQTTHYFEWEDGTEEYYNLVEDPFELENELAKGGPPQDLASIRAAVDTAAECSGSDCP